MLWHFCCNVLALTTVSSGEETAVLDEINWINGLKNGEMEYFDLLYHKYCKKLYALCYRFTRNTHDSEEQLQEIFMRMLDKIKLYKGESSFQSWLYRLATNHLLNHVKAGKKRQLETPLLSDEISVTRGRDHALALALEKAMAELPEGFRKVFVLHDQLGFRHEEIAEIIGCSPGNSRSQLSRGRLALREKLKPELRRCQFAGV